MKIHTLPRLHSLLAGLLLGLVTTLPAHAAESVPPLINYQGSLSDANGAPMAGVKTMEFNLYDAPTGGNLIWGPQVYATVPLIGGKFNVLLGPTDSGGKLITTAFADKTRYLSITIEGKEILPRQQILSTPYAFNGVPKGGIIMWSGTLSDIPIGYALCDGNNGTPNLMDRFIVGVGNAYKVADVGGEAQHILTINEMPTHDHGGGNHTHSTGLFNGAATVWGGVVMRIENNEAHPSNINYSGNIINGEGGNQPHENRPPFYALAYIMRK